MKKYIINCYGWSIESVGKSLTDEQVQLINEKMVEFGYTEPYEIMFEIEEFMNFDIWDGDLFHVTKALDNQTLFFEVFDGDGNKINDFDIKDITFNSDENIEYKEYSGWPNEETQKNIWLMTHENKGGVYSFEIESEEQPKPEDFSYSTGCISTPDGDWDFIEKIYFKNEEMEIMDYLDNTGKGTTVELFRFDEIDN